MNHVTAAVRIAAIASSLFAAGCNNAAQQGSRASTEAPLAGARIGGPFVLTDQHGRTVTDRSLAGRYRIMYFGYTFCPDVCPTDVQAIGAGLKKLEAENAALASRIVPVFITVDPARDTQAVVGQFVANFHPRMIGLTGTPQQVAAVAREYGVAFNLEKPNAPGSYLVSHSRQTYLMSPEGKPLALLPADQGADAVVAEIKRWAT